MAPEATSPLSILDPTSRARSPWAIERSQAMRPGERPPAILVVTPGGPEGARLDHPLADQGFRVFRTSLLESALDVLRGHPSVIMALVSMELHPLDPPSLIRSMREARPGLWIGMIADSSSQEIASVGYRAGASDLLPKQASPADTALRLARTVHWASRLRSSAERRLEPPSRSRIGAHLKRASRRLSRHVGTALALLAAGGLGAGMAMAKAAWNDFTDGWNLRFERVLRTVESAFPPKYLDGVSVERWYRMERLNLERESQRELLRQRQEQIEEERLRDVLSGLRLHAAAPLDGQSPGSHDSTPQ